jgi:tetratricopeptide (TPR) repeat protein
MDVGEGMETSPERSAVASGCELGVELALADRLADRGHVGAALQHYHRVAGELVSRGELRQALSTLTLAAELSPRCLYTKWALADLRRRCGDLVGAHRSFAQILRSHLRAGRWLEAHAVQRALLEIDPADVRGRVQLAELSIRLGRVDEACEHFRGAARRLWGEARHREYLWVAQRLLVLRPDDAATLREMVALFLQAGRVDDASASLYALLGAHPHDLGGRELMIELLGSSGRAAEAVTVALALAAELRACRMLLEASRVLSRAARFAPGDARVAASWVEVGRLLARAAMPDPELDKPTKPIGFESDAAPPAPSEPPAPVRDDDETDEATTLVLPLRARRAAVPSQPPPAGGGRVIYARFG